MYKNVIFVILFSLCNNNIFFAQDIMKKRYQKEFYKEQEASDEECIINFNRCDTYEFWYISDIKQRNNYNIGKIELFNDTKAYIENSYYFNLIKMI